MFLWLLATNSRCSTIQNFKQRIKSMCVFAAVYVLIHVCLLYCPKTLVSLSLSLSVNRRASRPCGCLYWIVSSPWPSHPSRESKQYPVVLPLRWWLGQLSEYTILIASAPRGEPVHYPLGLLGMQVPWYVWCKHAHESTSAQLPHLRI